MSSSKVCPKCEGSCRSVWTNGRMLRDECRGDYDYFDDEWCGGEDDSAPPSYCGWVGKPYTPTKKPIQLTKTVSYFEGGHWIYEIYDQYGHATTYSQGFNSKVACLKACKKDLETHKHPSMASYGKCTGILWGPTVKVKGFKVK